MYLRIQWKNVYQEHRCLEIAIYLSLTNHKALNACPPISNSLFLIPLIDKAPSKPIKPTLPPHPTHKRQPQAQNSPQRQPICPYPHKSHLLHCQPYNPTRAQPTQLTHTNLTSPATYPHNGNPQTHHLLRPLRRELRLCLQSNLQLWPALGHGL